jgi:prophage maintenance system killer protein
LTLFCVLNGRDLHVPTEEAVSTMLAVAAGELDEAGLAQWLGQWIDG